MDFVITVESETSIDASKLWVSGKFDIFNWPSNGKFELPGLQSRITKAYLLADNQDLKVNQTTTGAILDLPRAAPDKIASVICLEIEDSGAKILP